MSEVRVSITELELAYHRFKISWPNKHSCPWNTFLGTKVEAGAGRFGYYTTEEAANKIRALAGPHWKTLLKAWHIQYEAQKCQNSTS